MLKNARNRCQSTPIARFRDMTIAQTIETITLTSAITEIAHSQAGNHDPSQVEIGAAHVGYGNNPVADSKPRIRKMQIPIVRMTASTKYACGKLDPANRDFRPGRRGEFSCRTTIRYPMPSTVVSAINSTTSPYHAWPPIQGNSKPGSNVWPTACTRVSTRAPKPIITNQ